MKIKLNNRFLIIILVVTAPLIALSQITGSEYIATDSDGETVWYDAKYFGVEGKGWNNTESYYDRLPITAKGNVSEKIWNTGHSSAGMYLRFYTKAKTIKVRWKLLWNKLALPHMPATGVSGVDLYARDENGNLRYFNNGRPLDTINTVTFSLPSAEEYVLYLPLYNGLKSLEIGVSADTSLVKLPPLPKSQQLVFYGTSITQGACASRPGMAATTITGRNLNMPVINLGFSGLGKMEPEMADLLAELNPSVYVLDCLWNMTPDMVSKRLEPFVLKLRKTRPNTPILLVEDSNFKNQRTEKGEITRDIWKKLKKQGDKNLYYLSNKDMLGHDWDGTVDGTHPNDLGNYRQAEIFSKRLSQILKIK